jgi:hypothetical protein
MLLSIKIKDGFVLKQEKGLQMSNKYIVTFLQELKESFNYGLFAPPCNGKAGKFLDEERPLSDYPFSGPVGYLEVIPTS